MKKNTLKTLGIMVLSAALLAGAVTGCGSKETADVAGTEAVAVTETEETTEMVEVTEETETELPEETEVTGETETEEAPAFTVTEMSSVKYATQTVNVRKGPSSDYEKLGGLSVNQKVTVTGQADTGWYRIDYNGEEGYVSDKYLSDQKVSAPAKNTGGSTNGTTNAGGMAAPGNAGADQGGNAGSVNNAGNAGSTDTNTNTNNGGNTGSVPAPDNGGSTPAPDNSGNAGGADQGGNAVAPDNSGSTDAGNTGGDTSGNSGAPSDNWWESPEFDDVEDFVPQPGTGADDGTGLDGSSTWH